MERFFGSDVDSHAKQILKIQNQSGVVQQTSPGFPVDQEIEIAVFARFTPSHGTEDANSLRATPGGEP